MLRFWQNLAPDDHCTPYCPLHHTQKNINQPIFTISSDVLCAASANTRAMALRV
jgi:hypothetical protein